MNIVLPPFFSRKIAPIINRKTILEVHSQEPKRICFNSTHRNPLKQVNYTNGIKWAFFVPFEESLSKIFESETSLELYKMKNEKFWCPIKEEDKYNTIKTFIETYKYNVFLRDTLNVSMALSEYQNQNKERTEVGELEYQAKYHSSEDALNKLAEKTKWFIQNTPYYKNAYYICGIPSKKNLPANISNKVAEGYDKIIDISRYLYWENSEKEDIKNLDFENKWDKLDKAGLKIDYELKNKTLILLDDMYQSGTTMQYVAMKFIEAGVENIFGLSIVKARKDTDNQQ